MVKLKIPRKSVSVCTWDIYLGEKTRCVATIFMKILFVVELNTTMSPTLQCSLFANICLCAKSGFLRQTGQRRLFKIHRYGPVLDIWAEPISFFMKSIQSIDRFIHMWYLCLREPNHFYKPFLPLQVSNSIFFTNHLPFFFVGFLPQILRSLQKSKVWSRIQNCSRI